MTSSSRIPAHDSARRFPIKADESARDWRAEVANWSRKSEQVERLVHLGSFEVDLETNLLTWSAGTYAIFEVPVGSRISVEQALGFFGAEARSELEWHLATAKQQAQSYDLTLPFRSASGEERWARMIAQVEIGKKFPRLVGVIRDITRERNTEELLRLQAHQDTLTGLPNRRAFETHLDRVSGQARQDGDFGLCIVDIDRFKQVNDVHGHAAGDKLLQEVARRLSAAVRTTDLVARLGGDEFAVALHGVRGKADLSRRAAALVEAARDALPIDNVLLEPSVSVGASFRGRASLGAEALLKQADIALYKAKLNGRDQFCLFQPRFRKEVDDHGLLLDEVRTGLGRGQFEVHYQPIVDLRSKVVRGWEALVRWRHPSKGLLVPGRFLPALSDPTTSVAIDDFVLETSLRQMKQWIDGGVPVTCAGVNVSEAQLKRPDLVRRIVSLLEEHNLTPDRLKIEVLETAFVGHSTKAVAYTIDRLAEIGVVSALDDFGTGHASLTHLKQFRVERIKVDRSFIANLGTSGFDQAIVRCMITLGRDLGIRITAEGIETIDQLRLLRELGCDCGQGYLFGRPMHPDFVPGFLARWYGGEADRVLQDDHVFCRAPLRLV